MKGLKKALLSTAVIFGLSNFAQAGIVDDVIYNVVGQVSNALGARLGDEIYYGSSRGTVRHSTRRHHKKRRKKRKKVAKKSSKVPVISDEMKIQKALKSLGFYKGPLDGEVNSYETRSAIRELNKKYGIGTTAFLKPEVKDTLLYLGTLFSLDRVLIASGKDSKTKAKKIQAALKVLGYYHDKIDGLIGKGTRACIANFKRDNGMTPNGKLDFEEEYRLITMAKEKNEKSIDETIASLNSLGNSNKNMQTAQNNSSMNIAIKQPVQNRVEQKQAISVPQPMQIQNQVQQPINRQIDNTQPVQKPLQNKKQSVPIKQSQPQTIQVAEQNSNNAQSLNTHLSTQQNVVPKATAMQNSTNTQNSTNLEQKQTVTLQTKPIVNSVVLESNSTANTK
jgi:hypothetical protein